MYFEADISCFWGQHPNYYSWDIERFHGWWYNMGRERVAQWQIHRIDSKHWEIVTSCWPLSALVPDPDKMVHTDSGRHQNWSKHKIVWNNPQSLCQFHSDMTSQDKIESPKVIEPFEASTEVIVLFLPQRRACASAPTLVLGASVPLRISCWCLKIYGYHYSYHGYQYS